MKKLLYLILIIIIVNFYFSSISLTIPVYLTTIKEITIKIKSPACAIFIYLSLLS